MGPFPGISLLSLLQQRAVDGEHLKPNCKGKEKGLPCGSSLSLTSDILQTVCMQKCCNVIMPGLFVCVTSSYLSVGKERKKREVTS